MTSAWSSDHGRRLIFQRTWVRILALDTSCFLQIIAVKLHWCLRDKQITKRSVDSRCALDISVTIRTAYSNWLEQKEFTTSNSCKWNGTDIKSELMWPSRLFKPFFLSDAAGFVPTNLSPISSNINYLNHSSNTCILCLCILNKQMFLHIQTIVQNKK